MSDDAPIFLTGTIHPNDAPSFCREGVEYVIHTEPVPFQLSLRAREPHLDRQLAAVAAARERVVVRGVFRRQPRPGHDFVEVHAIDPVARYVSCAAAGKGSAAGGRQAAGSEGGPPDSLGWGWVGVPA